MKRDPFDHLRAINPLPEDQPVYPPMTTAERIVGREVRRSWPAWALAGGFALVALLAGGAWLLWIRGGTREVAATSAPPTTVADSTTAPIGEPPVGDAVVYFYVADDGTQLGDGPYLIPVARPLAVLSHFVTDPVYETLNFLLIGSYPGEEEAGPALFSAIPEGTELLGLEVADGIATVDFSSRFFAGSADDVRRRAGQVVFTLTRFDEIDGVLFRDEGLPFADWGDNAAAGDPVTRIAFADLFPAVMIESPAYWAGTGDGPLVVNGYAITGAVSLELLDQAGSVLWEGTTMTTCDIDCLGDFSIEIPYEVGEAQLGTLVAWETSMEDGRRLNVRRHPVWLSASGEQTSTTLDPISEQLALRYDLDKAIEATLAELEAIDTQLAGLGPGEGVDLRTQAAELDRYLADLRDQLGRVLDELSGLDAHFPIPCSAEGLGSELAEQPGLPAPVTELRTALYEAARSCDWQALQDLVANPAGFSYSFGESGDPVAYWQRLELLHYRPLYYLAEILQRPFGVYRLPVDLTPEGPPVYTWPSAQAYESWAEVPEADRAALRPLYDDSDFAAFEEFGGYLGFRVGIRSSADEAHWIYAIEGD